MIHRVHLPLYVHCLNGSEVVSLVIACLRKLQCWSISSTMAEFGRYCLVKPAHTSFIETFHLEIEIPRFCPRWLFRGIGPKGRDGVIPEHPTLKLKYEDTEMAEIARELRALLDEKEEEDNRRHDVTDEPARAGQQ
jgi:Tyrosine phosphatase family